MSPRMRLERSSDCELSITATIGGPVEAVFEARTHSEAFQHWWVPASLGMTLLACEMDVRPQGRYRLVFRHPQVAEPMAFHGRYLEVDRPRRLVWTNEEAEGAGPVTTVVFEPTLEGGTRLHILDRYPSRDALDTAWAAGAGGWNEETFAQLDAWVSASNKLFTCA